ncbi:MAG: AI-2E family transporter [Candidatus Pacebacteria bacterium]|nr:AI-2E family transporter [Candidatus Paceibacterota bacterium]
MKDVRIHFDKHNLFEVALIGILIYALWTIGDFLLVLGAGLIFSTFIEDFVQTVKKYKIPRVPAVVIFYVLAILVFGITFLFVIPVLAREIADLALVYPELQTFIESNTLFSQINTNLDSASIGNVLEQLQNEEIREQFQTSALSFFGGVLNLLIIFVVSFYLSVQEKGIDSMLRIFTPLKYEEAVVSLWHRVQRKVGSWFRGQLIIALILTVLTYGGLALFGVPYAFILALLAGVFGLVPYGIFLALLPAAALGAAQGGIWMGLGIIAFYVILQQILDLVLAPLIVNKLTGVPSLLVIISVFIGTKLFGLYGLVLAIPLALFAMEIIAESEKVKSKQREPLIEHEEVTVIVPKPREK